MLLKVDWKSLPVNCLRGMSVQKVLTIFPETFIWLIPPPANEVSGVYSDPYVRPFVRPSVRPSQSLIRYSSKIAEQNFMKLSGIVHYMMPYCTSYLKFLSAWFCGVPQQNKDFAITTYGGGDPSLIRFSSKTAEQNFMKLSGIVHYMMPYCTSYFNEIS